MSVMYGEVEMEEGEVSAWKNGKFALAGGGGLDYCTLIDCGPPLLEESPAHLPLL